MGIRFKTYSEFRELDSKRDELAAAIKKRGTGFLCAFRSLMLPRYIVAETGLGDFVPMFDRGDQEISLQPPLSNTLEYLLSLAFNSDSLKKDDFVQIWNFWSKNQMFRKKPTAHLIDEAEEVTTPEYIAGFLDTTLDWFEASSITGMHSVEQCCLMTMRLSDILPFQYWNFYLIRIIPWFYLLKNGYSPPIFTGEKVFEWFQCMKKAHHFYTSSLTHFYLRESLNSLDLFLRSI